MALSDAERQRRYRQRKRAQATRDVTDDDAVTDTGPVMPDLRTRGKELWRQVLAEGPLRPTEVALLREACRIADRLDKLDGILSGANAEWLRFRVSDDATEVTVTLDRALSEARQQATALKQLLAELRTSRAAGRQTPTRSGSAAGTGAGKGGGGVADLTARIAARNGRTAG